MKKFFLFSAALCSVLLLYAQPYQVRVYYGDGKVVNLGSSETVGSLNTGYTWTMDPYVNVYAADHSKDRGTFKYIGLGFPYEIDSLSLSPAGECPTVCQYLNRSGDYTYTLRLLSDLGYTEVLNETGCNFTFFAANDNAWRIFLASSACPVKSYEELSARQKYSLLERMLLRGSYPEARLGSRSGSGTYADDCFYKTSGEGVAIIRQQNVAYNANSVVYVPASKLPAGQYWEALRKQGGAYFAYPDASPTTVFTKMACEKLGITEEDMEFLTQKSYNSATGMYFYTIPVEKEIHCLNGYLYVLSELAFPPGTMDEELRNVPECTLFSSFLDRFTMPTTENMQGLYEGDQPVYRKAYFAQGGSYALRNPMDTDYHSQLLFDPSWQQNYFSKGETFDQNMAVMFVPTDRAWTEWWNSSSGRIFMNGINSWEEVPNDLLVRLVNNHLKTSFKGAFPSVFHKVLNDGNREQGIRKEDVVKVIQANNGIIYVVDKVYTPDAYISVMAPSLNVDGLKTICYAVVNTDRTPYIPDGYGTYLNSMENTFSFVAPTDHALQDYVNPFYVSDDGSYERVAFSVTANNRIQAVLTRIDSKGVPGTSRTIEFYMNGYNSTGTTGYRMVQSMLKDILDNCIVVMKQDDWSKGGYYQTKGGTYLDISSFVKGATVLSGRNTERNESPQTSDFFNQSNSVLNGELGSEGNGVTMVVDKVIQPSLKSVIEVLNEHPEFSEFAALLAGSDPVIEAKFSTKLDSLKHYQALVYARSGSSQSSPVLSRGKNISFLGNYNYTLYVPTNEAMVRAYQEGLPHWIEVNAISSVYGKQAAIKKIMDFIRFHFQCTSVCTDGEAGYYKTNAFNSSKNVFYEVHIQRSGNSYQVTPRDVPDSKVELLSPQNLMAREYVFNGTPSTPLAVGTATQITTSSSVVIHRINAPLWFSPIGTGGVREQFK